MNAEDLVYLSIAEAARLIKAGQLSPVELTQAYLNRIERMEGQLNAFITLLRDDALAAARQAEQEVHAGQYRGPMHGIPVALKDLIYTKGIRTTGGSKVLSSFIPAEDATVVVKLRAAGAVIVGKTGMHEFAYGTTGINPHYGTAHNPWDSQRMPGGSSSGSAVAVAAGLSAGAIGSDTGGSIRIPASLCGIVGLKPTYGHVSRHGVIALSWSLDHVGPMARTVEDAGLLLNAIAGYDPEDPASADAAVPEVTQQLRAGLRGLRVGVVKDYFSAQLDPEVAGAIESAVSLFEHQGAQVSEVTLPPLHQAHFPIIQSEAGTYHLPLLRAHWDDYSPEVRLRLLTSLAVTGTMYLDAQRIRRLMTERTRASFDQVDVLLTPTTPIPAPRLDEEAVTLDGHIEPIRGALLRFTHPFNLAGFPALSLPCGFTAGGLPIGLQLVGQPWDEATVLRAAYAYEQATTWHHQRPC